MQELTLDPEKKYVKTIANKEVLVSVIVVVKNAEKTITQCLDSLFAQEQPAEQYEVIVVDGGSKDRTLSSVEKYPVKLIKDDGGSISHGRNLGVQASRGEFVAFTDSDCVVPSDWLSSLFKELQSRDNIIALGGPNLVIDSDLPLSRVIGYMQETFLGSGGSPQSYAINEPRYVYSLANCNVMYKKRIFDEETFDNGLNIGEDCDLNYRLRKRGYAFLYLPHAVVWHYRPSSLKGFCDKMFSYGHAMAEVLLKHKRIVRWFAPVPSIVLALIMLNIVLLAISPMLIYPLFTFLSLYSVFLMVSTVQVYLKNRCRFSLLAFLLLPLQHLTYALGFWKGILWR
jgi:glycosyltransferase involved in cell wall biosynthesis